MHIVKKKRCYFLYLDNYKRSDDSTSIGVKIITNISGAGGT